MGDAIGGSSAGGVRAGAGVEEMEGVICNYENGHWSFCEMLSKLSMNDK